MTIIGIIENVGEPRAFEVPTTQGGKKQMTAREITIASGYNTFVCDAYDAIAARFDNAVTKGVWVAAELRFDSATVKTNNGGSFHRQQVTLVALNF